MPTLFDSLPLGAIQAPNRVLMAPLTRARADRAAVPTPIMADYYAQRAGSGLIISEATGISREGLGWPHAPGLWTEAQVEGWKPVVAAVHAAGGRIVAQLWHMGRVVHSSLGGGRPVSASAITAPGQAHTYDGKQDYEQPRALEIGEIGRVVGDYVAAARGAIAAGFDGVQVHAANGYLIDQFLRDSANRREDGYGGSIDNRVRLLREVTQAVAGEVGAGRTSVRLSPNGEANGTIDSDPEPLFVRAAEILGDIGIGFLELREAFPEGTFMKTEQPRVAPAIRKVFPGPLVLNQDYDFARAEAAIAEGEADAISFGRPWIANPDLVRRLREGAALNPLDTGTLYSQGPEGYTDYPALA